MLRSIIAVAVIAFVVAMAFITDALDAGRFDRRYLRNRAARRPDLHLVDDGRGGKR